MRTNFLPRWAILLVSIAVLVLSFAALDDITTGTEPNFYLEYTMLFVAGLWFINLLAPLLRKGRIPLHP
ncbi:MAG: hypothetical protein IPN20_16255 [Haliscomenobacter sp.]|jgi:hypothetical protein|nr:hypothetical protein [Haliscomenobacter sp.]MBK8655416.1 hypothetical protein [Haliscomenobacter sp.]MBV6426040.1 hypothetical protein [Haliscomenobacter sp.]